MSNPIIDPEFRSLIPPLSTDEREQLETNIVAEGCRDALVVWRGILLDGHNRFEICERLGLPYNTVEIELPDRDAAADWIDKNQLGRRNLTPDQMRLLRGRRYNRAKNQGARTDLTCGQNDHKSERTAERLASEHGVSEKTIRRDAKFAEEVERTPELLEAVSTGKPVLQAKREIRDQERKVMRTEIANRAKEKPPSDRWNIFNADIRDWKHEHQYDAIITDPPYPKEYLSLWSILAERSCEWLKPGGLLIAMSGQSYLDEIYTMLSEYLTYYWTAAYLTPGQPTPLRQRNVNTSWKPILIFANGEYTGKIFGDVFKSDMNDKDWHHWGQSESGMFSVVSKMAISGEYILDPFCGAGTTGVAALKHGCLFDGVEIDHETSEVAKGRLYDAQGL